MRWSVNESAKLETDYSSASFIGEINKSTDSKLRIVIFNIDVINDSKSRRSLKAMSDKLETSGRLFALENWTTCECGIFLALVLCHAC